MLKYEPWARHLIEQVCLIFMLGCMLLSSAARLAEAASTSELVWLKQGEMKFARDGSAYCELVLMQGEQPLRLAQGSTAPSITAQCQYRIRGREYREKCVNLTPFITEPEVRYKVSSPVSSQCNVMVKLELPETIFLAQSYLPLYGRGYDKESFLEDSGVASQKLIEKPELRMLANRNPLMGREVEFLYTGMVNGQLVTGYSNGLAEKQQLTLKNDGHFIYHFPQRAQLEVNTDEKIEALLVVESPASGKKVINTCSFLIHSHRYSYPNLTQGLLLFAGTALLTVVVIIWWRRRTDKYAY